jgi:hypothetical protein
MRNAGLLSAIVVVSSLAGCAADTATEAESTSDPLVSNAWSDNVTVRSDRLVFERGIERSADFDALVAKVRAYEDSYAKALSEAPSTLTAEEMDEWITDHLRERGVEPVYLIGKRQSDALNPDGSIRRDVKNPYGYLRRATGIASENGAVVVLTKPASIAEASVELERMGLLQVTREARADGDDDHWEWTNQYPFTIANVDLSKVLYEKTFGAGIGTVRVRFKDSHVRVTGNLDARVAGRWVRPRHAHAILTTNLEGQLLLEGAFDNAFGVSTGDISLYQKSFDITSIGGYPVSLDFEVEGSCDLAANGKVNAQVGERIDGSLQAGGSYAVDHGFGTVWQPQWPTFTHIGPTLTSNARVEGKCAVTATARVHLFDALGPEAAAQVFVTLDANATTSDLTGRGRAKVIGGVDAWAGGTLRPFGVTLATISTPPFHREWVLFDREITLP